MDTLFSKLKCSSRWCDWKQWSSLIRQLMDAVVSSNFHQLFLCLFFTGALSVWMFPISGPWNAWLLSAPWCFIDFQDLERKVVLWRTAESRNRSWGCQWSQGEGHYYASVHRGSKKKNVRTKTTMFYLKLWQKRYVRGHWHQQANRDKRERVELVTWSVIVFFVMSYIWVQSSTVQWRCDFFVHLLSIWERSCK